MSVLASLSSLIVLFLVVTIVVALVRRSSRARGDAGDPGADTVAYLLMALSMSVAGIAMAQLLATAFPANRLVFAPASDLAISISALVVSAPFAIYFWRRQARRRVEFPGSSGWTLYLTLIGLVFGIAFVVTAVPFVDGLLTNGPADNWTRALVFAAVLAFHEWAASVTPPRSGGSDLPRVVGAAIGLVTLGSGLTGLIGRGLLAAAYDAMTSTTHAVDFHPWLAMTIVGAPLWWYRWLRPWPRHMGVPRQTYLVLVSVTTLSAGLGGLAAIVASIADYLTDGTPAGEHFDSLPIQLALLTVGLVAWILHRRRLGIERTDRVRAYGYAMAAIGLGSAVSMAVLLTRNAFGTQRIVGGTAGQVLGTATFLIAGAAVFLWFTYTTRQGDPAEETASWPRHFYLLGVGIAFGLVAAGALITTLFVLINRLLDNQAGGTMLTPAAITVYSGLAAWYLIATFLGEREATETGEAVLPFAVTVVCSDPGPIAKSLPKQARLQIIARGDDAGDIDEDLAGRIAAAVAHEPSLVWVENGDFHIAPARAR